MRFSLSYVTLGRRYNEELELEDAVHTAILTLKVSCVSVVVFLHLVVFGVWNIMQALVLTRMPSLMKLVRHKFLLVQLLAI